MHPTDTYSRSPHAADRAPERSQIDEPPPRNGRPTDARLALLLASLASAAAGIIHGAAAPAHWDEWPISGVFFAGVALFQLVWAVVALPLAGRFLAAVGILANGGLLGLWAYSRWEGLPMGPHAGAPEAIGLADVLAAGLGAVVIAGAFWALLPRERHGVLKAGGYRTVVFLAGAAMAVALIPGIDGALSHGGEGHDHGPAEDGGHHGEGGEDEHDHGETDDETEGEATTEPAGTEEEDHTHAPGEEHD
ncbi:hypothetical protein [Glycomyces xiaoerkulensis]|uniref:hypothetical protein n=1 Tax=Glycomyces xiaoerkulensis TaxID=2038139 RepID=UPI000C2666D6|nr:hypothetical protein [Glycomyces xiaoerkulensis]